jgi:ABC-2 type transport system permease protein
MPDEGEQPGIVSTFARNALTIAEMEARKIKHSSSELWIRAIQPALWLLVFGEALSAVRELAPPNYGYMAFITPGVLAQSVLFIAIFYGITLVWERDLGLLSKLLASPTPRSSVIVGKALAASIRGIFQAVIIFSLAIIIGTGVRVTVASVAAVTLVVVLLAMCFSGLSMIIASIAKTRERMMGLSQVLTFPLFFASNAIYPTSVMPVWLQVVATLNPLTYGVQGIRSVLLAGSFSNLPTDLTVLAIFTTVLLAIASITVRRILR